MLPGTRSPAEFDPFRDEPCNGLDVILEASIQRVVVSTHRRRAHSLIECCQNEFLVFEEARRRSHSGTVETNAALTQD
jgi:hypothetical protein